MNSGALLFRMQYETSNKGLWKLWKVLEKAGVTLSGCVEGKLAPFGVEGTFHYGHDGGENHVLSEASSAVCKCWMVAAARGKLDEKVAQCIGCTFGGHEILMTNHRNNGFRIRGWSGCSSLKGLLKGFAATAYKSRQIDPNSSI